MVRIFFEISNGKVHSYERTYPTYHNKRVSKEYNNPKAPTYIVGEFFRNLFSHRTLVGCAGNTEGLYGNYTQHPEWSAFQSQADYGYGMMNIFEKVSAFSQLSD
jgi:hypothetical protein